jgi:hypothetical protein
MFSQKQGFTNSSGGSVDPYFSSVNFLLRTFNNGYTNDRTYVDSSSNALTISAPTSPYWSYDNPFTSSGYHGCIFNNGINSQTISGMTFPTNSTLTPSGNCTIEFWVKAPSATGTGWTFSTYSEAWNSTYSQNMIISERNSTTFYNAQGYSTPTFSRITSSVTASDNTWHHIALVKNGTGSNNLTFYVNGVSQGTASISTNTINCSAGAFLAGSNNGSDNPFTGWGTLLRFSNIARYTSNFTPPTAPWANDANTLIYNQFTSYAILDVSTKMQPFTPGSGSGQTLTLSTSVEKFSGLPSIQFAGSVVVNSASSFYYAPNSGTGQLVVSGNFTWECWVYVASSTTQQTTSTVFGSSLFSFVTNSSAGANKFAITVSGTTTASTVTSNDSNWHFLTVQRTGTGSNNFYWWIDGVAQTTLTYATSVTFAGASPFIGSNNVANSSFIGYMSEMRFTNGVSRYTGGSNFTPPSTQFPSQ